MAHPIHSALDAATADAIDEVYRLWDPPLWIVTAADGERRGGLVATFVVRASIVATAPRMVIGIAKQHHTWRLIEVGRGFALHLLAADQLDLVWRFGLATGHDTDKFAGCPSTATPSGQPRLMQAIAWLDCRVEGRLDIGDRTLYLGAVTAGGTVRRTTPMTVATLYDRAPPERREELSRLYVRDGALDEAAIRAWRADGFPA